MTSPTILANHQHNAYPQSPLLLLHLSCQVASKLGLRTNPQHVTKRKLTGQTAIVAGANSGIGLHIAIALAKQGATVHLACRNADRGAATVDHVIAQCDDERRERVTCRILDVGDLSSVHGFCSKWKQGGAKIDMLVHNAGIAALPAGSATKTADGLEMPVHTTNFLDSFLMPHLLEPHLSTTARVVLTSSTGSYSGAAHFLSDIPPVVKHSAPGIIARSIARGKTMLSFVEDSSASAYGLSKAQQVLFAALLQLHFDAQAYQSDGERTHRTAHAFTLGFTSTPIFVKLDVTWRTWFTNSLFATLKTTEKWVAVDTNEGAKTGAWRCGEMRSEEESKMVPTGRECRNGQILSI